MEPSVVLYHSPCTDGLTAAYCLYKRWPNAKYIGCQYGDPLPVDAVSPDDTVVMVDFTFKRDLMLQLAQIAKHVVVLDHHKSAVADLEGFKTFNGSLKDAEKMLTKSIPGDDVPENLVAHFDMGKSGARLAQEYANPDVSRVFVSLVEDRDLWRFDEPNSRPFHYFLTAQPQTFKAWDEINDRLFRRPGQLFKEAQAIQDYVRTLVETIADTAYYGLFAPTPYSTPDMAATAAWVNCPPVLSSDVCHRVLARMERCDFAASFSYTENGVKYSLRSRQGGADVSRIAEQYGGGGHANAAGFFISHHVK
jgi:hypothetical protein